MKASIKSVTQIGLMLFCSTVYAEGTAPIEVKTVTLPEDVKALMTVRCQPCHFELKVKPSLLLNTTKWFRRNSETFEIERRVFNEEPPHSMPMGALLSEKEKTILRSWLKQLQEEL